MPKRQDFALMRANDDADDDGQQPRKDLNLLAVFARLRQSMATADVAVDVQEYDDVKIDYVDSVAMTAAAADVFVLRWAMHLVELKRHSAKETNTIYKFYVCF